MVIITTIIVYFLVLLLIGRITTRHSDNDTFYRGNRQSPWYMVAFGMVGASISGISFVSVPGMVMKTDMTYLQMCIGFILGYFAIAFILLPVYYRLRLTTIYSYLKERLGLRSYKTGASFFLLSKMTGAAVRFYVVCMILQKFVLDAGRALPHHRHRTCCADMALYKARRDQDARLDRYVPDTVYVCRPHPHYH